MNKFLNKPKKELPKDLKSKYNKYNLIENPFPSNPIVNIFSTNDRINGNIYESEIRKDEYNKICSSFLKFPQTDLNHHRLGYIIDKSYIGRGNGKSAFLINLVKKINQNYSLDLSENLNKCFAIYIEPEPGGRTKSFIRLTEKIVDTVFQSNLVEVALVLINLAAIFELYPGFDEENIPSDEEQLIAKLTNEDWYKENGIKLSEIYNKILINENLQELPPDFPLFNNSASLITTLITQNDIVNYYKVLKQSTQKIEFVYSHLISLFLASGFNGGYIFIDDYERIPDFQSARQKRDFASELRSTIFDGPHKNAIYGFFNFFLVLHAGVPRLISQSWEESGLEHRAPISSNLEGDHVIPFGKISQKHAELLIMKYLNKYRLNKEADSIKPFTKDSISSICRLSELNAAKILRTCYQLLESASEDEQGEIDVAYIEKLTSSGMMIIEDESISDVTPTDLASKAEDD